MSSPISSALEKLDGSLLALQSEVDCLRAGLEVSEEQLGQRLAEARDHAMAVRDLISAERAGARWGDREALNLLIRELETAAQEKVNDERRTRLLELASEFEAGSIKHRFESRVSALNALRAEAVAQLRADAALKEQEKVLPGPDAGEWLSWACNLQEDTDASTLDELQRDFAAVASFTGEMEESYWVPGTRAPVSASAPAARPAAQPVKEAAPARPAPPPIPPAPKPPVAVAAPPPAPKPAPTAVAPPPAAPKPATAAAPPAAPKPPATAAAPPPPAPKPATVAAPPPAPKPATAPVPPPAAAKDTKPAQPATQPDKKPAPAPTAPAPAAPTRPQVAATAAAVAVQLEKPAPMATAQATQPAASAKAAERPAKESRPVEPARPSAQAKWQAAAPAPAKEPTEKKAVAAATTAAPAAVTPTRMKFCDKCGSTYPAQFNVCPIDTSPLRFADEPAAAAPGRDGSSVVEKTAVAAGAAAVAAQATSKARAAEKSAPEKPRESAKVEVSEIRATLRPHDDDALVAEDHKAADWQTLLRDKNWAALAANPVVLAAATLILILLVGGIVWKARRSHTPNDSVKAMEKAPEQPAANSQPGLVTNSVAQPVSSTPSATTTVKPPDQNAKQNGQPGKDAQPKPENPSQNAAKPAEVLSVPTQAPREVAAAKPPTNDPIEPPSSIPGALPNTSPNNLGAIAKDVPVAVPTLNQQKLRVSSGVAQAQLTHKVNPQYPPEAFQSRVHGTVVLQAVIGKDGGVKAVKVVSGPPMLVKSATEAVKQWRYKPFTLNGEAVEADTQINVNFSME